MLTAADVRSARFTATKFRSGYAIDEVDALLERSARTLDHLEQGLTVEADGTPLLTPDDLLSVRFSPTELTEGYFVDEVDDLLDAIVDTLNTYIGRAERGEPLVQPGDASVSALAAEQAPTDGDHDAGADAGATVADAVEAAEADAAASGVTVDDAVDDATDAAVEPADEPEGTVVDAADAADDEPATDEPATEDAEAEPVAAEPVEAEPVDTPRDTDAGTDAEPFAPATSGYEHVATPHEQLAAAELLAAAATIPAAPEWSPPASTDVAPPAWGAPSPVAAGSEPLDDASVDDADDPAAVDPGPDPLTPASSSADAWAPPADQAAPWSPPEPVRWTAQDDETVASGTTLADDAADASLLASAEESPWASLDGDEPVALDLAAEVRDAERSDVELPGWLTDAQPEMAETDVAEPAADAPTRVSAFAFAARPADPDVADDAELDAPTLLMSTVPDATPAPEPAPQPEPEPEPEPQPYVAPADALDSQGFLRQLTFARATSTGAAKDSLTIVGPDGRVYSAVGVRKTPEGLVVELG